MRIVLVNPNPMKPPVTPVALDYLAAACRDARIEVDLVDCCVQPAWRETLCLALTKEPTLVGVTIRNVDDSFFASRDFALRRIGPVVDEIKRVTQAPVCLGGVGFSIFPVETLTYCRASLGLCGEGEEALVRLAQALEHGQDLQSVPGLVRIDNSGYTATPPAPVRLKALDLASRSLVDNRYYVQHGGQVGFETKRGCSYKCIYCPEPVLKGHQVRMREPANIVKELGALYDQGVDVFHTCDSEFNDPYPHALAVCEAIVDSGLGRRIQWYAYCSPEHFTAQLASRMQRAGCVGIDFGADHGQDAMLSRLGHRYTSGDLIRIRKICLDHELVCMFDLLLGAPGETRHSIQTTVDLMKRIRPHRVGISLGVRLYPFTELGRQIRKNRGGRWTDNPSLFGELAHNESWLRPIYFCEASLGQDVEDWLEALVGGDPIFLLARRTDAHPDYNYNDNPQLTEAIRKGHRGAFWDILRRVSEGIPPLTRAE